MGKLPNQILCKLVCQNCGDFLSVGPISVLPDNNIICGRCYKNGNLILGGYSAAAKHIIFPCKFWNTGCPKFLAWKEVHDHEKNCGYNPKKASCCSCCCRSSKAINDSGAAVITADEALMRQIVCESCNAYLNSAPIYAVDINKNICWRCGSDDKYLRNFALETILENFYLKCSYRNFGCTKYNHFGEPSLHHEKLCREQRHANQFHMNQSDLLAHQGIKVLDPRLLDRPETHGKNSPVKPFNDPMLLPRPSFKDERRASYKTSSFRKENFQYEDIESSRPSSRATSGPEDKSGSIPQDNYNNQHRDSINSNSSNPRKIRGVIKTTTGHIYATLTPSNIEVYQKEKSKMDIDESLVMKLPPITHQMEVFSDDLKKNIQNRQDDYPESESSYNSRMSNTYEKERNNLVKKTESFYANQPSFNTHQILLKELRAKQKLGTK